MSCPNPCVALDPGICRCLPLGCDGNFLLNTSSGSTSSTSSGSFSNNPFCLNGQILCNSGNPDCDSGNISICATSFGLPPELEGPGCTDVDLTFFEQDTAFCSSNSRNLVTTKSTCNKNNLCPKFRKRTESCREDKTQCKCICPFEAKNQRLTPRCSIDDFPACSKDLKPNCTKPNNRPVCKSKKLFCLDIYSGVIDLVDKVFCK